MVENSLERKIKNEKYSKEESSTMLSDQTIELNFVRNRLETFQDTVLRDVNKLMSGMIDEVMQELRKHQLQTNEFRNFATPQISHQNNNANIWRNRIITTTDTTLAAVPSNEEHQKELITTEEATTDSSNNLFAGNSLKKRSVANKYRDMPTKVFVMRESLLTALLEIDHMKAIYYIFYIIFLIFLCNNVTQEYLVKGSVSFGLSVFKGGFESIHKVFGIWILQHLFVFSVFFAFKAWSQFRANFHKHKTLQRLWSISCLLIYIATQLVFAYVPTKICVNLNLPFATASVLLLETIRLLMKMHSFVRTVAPRVLAGKQKAEETNVTNITLPTFSKYLYFLFAPTFLYRDEYPRTSTIRWKYALSRLFEVIAIAFLYSYIYERNIKHHFGRFGIEEVNATTLTIKLFGMILPGIIIFLAGFYMILHAWLNFTAELLRFGDRMFYGQWWTASNYESYYRNWNVVVHDWLYEYLYKDLYTYVFRGSKNLSLLFVFMISALFHEYVLGYALQVFFPIMFFFFFVVGVILIFLTRYVSKNVGNFILWYTLIHGSSWVISFYSMEYFTSLNSPKSLNTWKDYLVPHVWQHYLK